jgi:hypothetical protein
MDLSDDEISQIQQETKTDNELKETLASDVQTCIDILAQQDTQFARRTLARTIFAAIEGLTHTVKRAALHHDGLFNERLWEVDRAFLKEECFDLHDNGEVKTKKLKISLKTNVRLAFRTFAHMAKLTLTLNVGDDGWNSFLKSIAIRDRLMHPKNPTSLIVSDDEKDTLEKSYVWFANEYLRFMEAFTARMNEET